MKKYFTLCIFFLLSQSFPTVQAQSQNHSIEHHPEKGILPFNAPCQDCQEIIEKRSADTREFYKMENGSKTIYMQRSLGAMNFKDENGYWRTIDPVLKKEGGSVYAARQQPAPVVVDLDNKVTSISKDGKEFRFNKNISLSHINADGVETNLGEGDWSRVSVSSNFSESAIIIQDFYPGIDLQLISSYGRIETSFIIRNKLLYVDGWLALKQQVEIPAGLYSDLSQCMPSAGDHWSGKILISDDKGKEYFYFKTAHAYDAQELFQNYIEMPFSFQADKLSYFIPVSWLNDPSTVYPVVLDPFVSASDSLPEASISGSGYSPVCDSLGCSYFINNFNMPANCEVTEISTYFSYLANLPCVRDDGGFSITMTTPVGSCSTRHFTCLGGLQGACFFWPAQLLYAVPPLAACMPLPQCASYPVDFEMKFRRCNQLPLGGCDATCILANSQWIINVTGRTMELTTISLPQTICEGECASVVANGAWGVPPYNFNWAPGGMTGDTISVCPTTSTNYMVTATDACGNIDTASVEITVVNGQSPDFSIFPNDSVCGGTQLTFSANSTDPDSLFSWIINCQSIDTIQDMKVINYSAPNMPAICTATMQYHITGTNSGCLFTTTDTFYVMTGSSPSVSLNGPDTICQGLNTTYTAAASFGGTVPVFQWYLNGAAIPGADSTTYSAIFSNGDTLAVSMTSTDSCSLGTTVWDTIQMTVLSYTMPTVAIHTVVDTICSGYQEGFTLSASNAGVNPQLLWFQNGVQSGSGSGFFTTVYFGDEIVAMVIAHLACALSDTVTDTSTVLVLPLTAPVVDITVSEDPICVGDTVTFNSTVTNIAIPPSYRWYKNGNFVGLNPSYTSSNLTSSDTLELLIMTPNPCGPDSASDTVFVHVNPFVIPVVSLTGTDTICAGDTAIFSASSVNGGSSPIFEWFLNGILSGNDSSFSSSSLLSGDSLSVIMRSSAACATPDSATDFANILLVPTVIPVVLIAASNDTICAGDPATFTTIDFGAGNAPIYQWTVNGVPIPGATNLTYVTSALASGDTVGVVMTSSALCSDPDYAEDFITVVVENCLGIETNAQSVFTMHPNPAAFEVELDFRSAGFSSRDIFIYDALGRKIFSGRGLKEKSYLIDISTFSSAVYFVKVMEGENEFIQKLVVE